MSTLKYRFSQYAWDNMREYGLREQPLGPNPYVTGAQESQQRPITLGLHWHCPPNLLHDELNAPTWWQLQAVDLYRYT